MSFSRISFTGAGAIRSLVAAASLASVSAQEIIYDNTETFLNNYAVEKVEYGDEVELSGTARTLYDISFEYFGEFAQQGDEMAKIRIYSNEKPYDIYRNEPTKVLYESGFFPINPGYHSKTLPGKSTLLPDVVTFTIEFRGISESETAGLLLYSPATVGKTYNEFWIRHSGDKWKAILFSLTDPKLKANAALRLRAVETVRLSSINVSPENTLQFVMAGLSGANYSIQSSSDLKIWSPVTTQPVPGASATYTSAIPAGERQRFYRVRVH